jgi:hypothetical protein
MLGVTLAIMFAGAMVADAIMFVNGYKSWIFHAKTDQEKAVRRKWFKDREIEWDDENGLSR